MNHKPLLLCFDLDEHEKETAETLSAEQDIRCVHVGHEDYHKTLGELCGAQMPPSAPYEGEGLPEGMLLFAFFSDQQVQMFLGACKKRGLERPTLLALLTETNVTWTPVELCRQLTVERENFRAKMKSYEAAEGHHHGHEHGHHHHHEHKNG